MKTIIIFVSAILFFTGCGAVGLIGRNVNKPTISEEGKKIKVVEIKQAAKCNRIEKIEIITKWDLSYATLFLRDKAAKIQNANSIIVIEEKRGFIYNSAAADVYHCPLN